MWFTLGLCNSRSGKEGRSSRLLLLESRGAELIEFALVLPFLLVFFIGMTDFAGAFLLQQKLAGAAQEALRIATVQSMSDLSLGASSTTIPKVRDAAVNSLKNANLAVCGLDTATPSYSSYTWTYTSTGTCSSAVTLTINRGVLTPTTSTLGGFIGGQIYAEQTQVTLSYPYTWKIGQIIQLLLKSGSLTLPATISAQKTGMNSA